MSPKIQCMTSGDLLTVRMSAGVYLQTSSTPSICNSQLYISTECRRISSVFSLDYNGRLNNFFMQKGICPSHLLHIKRKNCFPVSAAIKETAEEVAVNKPSLESSGSESLIRNELSALDAYFNKLQGKAKVEPEVALVTESKEEEDARDGELSAVTSEPLRQDDSVKTDDAVKTDLRSIEMYLEKLSKGPISPMDIQIAEREIETLLKDKTPGLQPTQAEEVDGDAQLHPYVEEPLNSVSSESLAVYIIAAINIAVYLFGLASPVDTAGMGTSTLPLLYGAKVNELLLNGEWWRLVTSMFLHSGFFHIALSSWALLFFGPQVESVFGPLAFCMIYFLGGLCGNICSFFFTPAATVGGTGPLFALFSSWVAYLWLNRQALGEQSADYGIKATTLMGVLVLGLSCLLSTDEWIHVGAVLPGILFGSFAAPLLQIGVDGIDPSTKNVENKGQPYAIFDSPSALSLSVVFLLSTGLCFTIYNILAAALEVENSGFLNNVPF